MPADGEATGQAPTLWLPRRTGLTLAIIGLLHLLNALQILSQTLAAPYLEIGVVTWEIRFIGVGGLMLALDLAVRGRTTGTVALAGLGVTALLVLPFLWTPDHGFHAPSSSRFGEAAWSSRHLCSHRPTSGLATRIGVRSGWWPGPPA